MRPVGDIRLAILQAAHLIHRERAATGQGPTLAKIVERSQVGYKAARNTVANLTRSGQLAIVDTCKVEGRNRPAAVYAPVEAHREPEITSGPGWLDLSKCLRAWTE